MVGVMLTFDEMIAPSLKRREVTIQGLAGSPTLTFDAADASNPRWLAWVLGREERGTTPPDESKPEGLAALRAGREQALELADMICSACLVSMTAADASGARVEYSLEFARKLIEHVAMTAPAAFFKLFETLRDTGDSGIDVLTETVAGEASGG